VAAASLAVSLLLTACHVLTPTSRLLVMATALVPLALVGYVVAVAGSWAVRRLSAPGRVRSAATAALTASLVGVLAQIGLALPSYAGSHASGPSDLTVMTSNLHLGQADPAAVAAIAAHEAADVVVLEEVTPQEMQALTGLRASYPYVAGGAAPWAYGTVVLSRFPLSEVLQLHVSKGAWLMRVAAQRPFWLIAVHTAQPLTAYPDWAPDHDALLAAVRRLDGPLVLAGDFNATLDHRPMRQLLAAGLSDAARQSNAGWQATWPADERSGRLVPFGLGLMTLDHVLFSADFSAVSTSTHEVPRSDHRALVARLALR
jgi:endonuclease/exonuclease/phosphatase (EEP) superfamily protein YafD